MCCCSCFLGCTTKYQKRRGLKQLGLTASVLEAGSEQAGHRQGWLLLRLQEGPDRPASSSVCPWRPLVCRYITSTSASVFTWPLCARATLLVLGAPVILNSVRPPLHLIPSQVTFTGSCMHMDWEAQPELTLTAG